MRLLVVAVLPLLLGAGRCTPDPPAPTPAPCPEGQCLLGWTNAVPPQPVCGECPTPPPADCRETGCPAGQSCKLGHGGYKCVADQPPASACPKPLAAGAEVYLNDKPYGQGFDATVRVHGDPEFCKAIHGVAIDDCHLEGWPSRVQCEMELIGGCPVWQFSRDEAVVIPCVDDQDALASCDHFGSVEYRDDPKTPTTGDSLKTLQGFEGRPLACGLQRDIHGPVAGFFTVAHGKGQVRACKPDGTGCGPWRPVDH